MKVRSDFVTNSSSVSYIITMSPKITDVEARWLPEDNNNASVVMKTLKQRMEKDGTRVMLEDEEIYTYKVEFGTDEVQIPESLGLEHKDIDLASMESDQLWDYILGEYIMNGRIAGLYGFGSTQVETY